MNNRTYEKKKRLHRNETVLPPHLDSVHISTRPFRNITGSRLSTNTENVKQDDLWHHSKDKNELSKDVGDNKEDSEHSVNNFKENIQNKDISYGEYGKNGDNMDTSHDKEASGVKYQRSLKHISKKNDVPSTSLPKNIAGQDYSLEKRNVEDKSMRKCSCVYEIPQSENKFQKYMPHGKYIAHNSAEDQKMFFPMSNMEQTDAPIKSIGNYMEHYHTQRPYVHDCIECKNHIYLLNNKYPHSHTCSHTHENSSIVNRYNNFPKDNSVYIPHCNKDMHMCHLHPIEQRSTISQLSDIPSNGNSSYRRYTYPPSDKQSDNRPSVKQFQKESHFISLKPSGSEFTRNIEKPTEDLQIVKKGTMRYNDSQANDVPVNHQLHHLPNLQSTVTLRPPPLFEKPDICIKCNKSIYTDQFLPNSSEELRVVQYSTFSNNNSQQSKLGLNTQSTNDTFVINEFNNPYESSRNEAKINHKENVYTQKPFNQCYESQDNLKVVDFKNDRKRFKLEQYENMHVYGVSKKLPREEQFLVNLPNENDPPKLVIMCQVPATGAALLKKTSPLRAPPSRRSLIPRKPPKNPSTGFLKDEPDLPKYRPLTNPLSRPVIETDVSNKIITQPYTHDEFKTPDRAHFLIKNNTFTKNEEWISELPEHFRILKTFMYQSFSQTSTIDSVTVGTRVCAWVWDVLQSSVIWQECLERVLLIEGKSIPIWLNGNKLYFLPHNATFLISCYLLEASSMFEKSLKDTVNRTYEITQRDELRQRMQMEQHILSVFAKEVIQKWIQSIRNHILESDVTHTPFTLYSGLNKLISEHKNNTDYIKRVYNQVTSLSTYLVENNIQVEDQSDYNESISLDSLLQKIEDKMKELQIDNTVESMEKDPQQEILSETNKLLMEQKINCFAIFQLERKRQLKVREDLRQRFINLEEVKRKWIQVLSLYTKQTVQQFAETRQKQRQYLHNLINTDHINAQSQTLLFCPKCYFPVPNASLNHPQVTKRRSSVYRASKRLTMRMSIEAPWNSLKKTESESTCFCPHCGNHFDVPFKTSDLLNIMPQKDVRRRSTANPFLSSSRRSTGYLEQQSPQKSPSLKIKSPEKPEITEPEKPTCWNLSKKQLLSNIQHSAVARRVGVLGLLSSKSSIEESNVIATEKDTIHLETGNLSEKITINSPFLPKRESTNVLDTVDQLLTTPTDRTALSANRLDDTMENLPELQKNDWNKQRRRKTWSFTTRLKGRAIPAIS